MNDIIPSDQIDDALVLRSALMKGAALNIAEEIVGKKNPYSGETITTEDEFAKGEYYYAGLLWTEETFKRFLVDLKERRITLEAFSGLIDCILEIFPLGDLSPTQEEIAKAYNDDGLRDPEAFMSIYIMTRPIAVPAYEELEKKFNMIAQVQLMIAANGDATTVMIEERRKLLEFFRQFTGQSINLVTIAKRIVETQDFFKDGSTKTESEIIRFIGPLGLSILTAVIFGDGICVHIAEVVAEYIMFMISE